MGIRITSQEKKVVLYDSTTEEAFGPVFDSETDAESFLEFVGEHAILPIQKLTRDELVALYEQWFDDGEQTLGDDDA